MGEYGQTHDKAFGELCHIASTQKEKSPTINGDFSKIWAGQDLPSGHFTDVKCLQAGLAVFAFRPHFVRSQTKTSLRLSRPSRGQSSLPACGKNLRGPNNRAP